MQCTIRACEGVDGLLSYDITSFVELILVNIITVVTSYDSA